MPLTAVPTALFHEIGSIMRSTTKSDLLHRLEEGTSAVKTLPGRNPSEVVYIRDAMAELHKLEGKKFQTFDKFAKHYTCELTKAFSFADKVIDIFDQYREDSVKNQTRTKRTPAEVSTKEYSVLGSRSVPSLKNFCVFLRTKWHCRNSL